MTNPDAAWRRIRQQVQETAHDRAEDLMRRDRERERKALAEALGITIPTMPPRLPGEDDKTYGCRIAWIAKSHCGPAPRPKVAPKRIPEKRGSNRGDVGEIDKMPPTDLLQNSYSAPTPPGEDTMVCHGERLANMDPDLTTEEDP